MTGSHAASNRTPTPVPPPAAPRGARKVTVYVTNGVRTSDGPGPGVREVGADEASALIAAKLAIAGSEPPDGYPG